MRARAIRVEGYGALGGRSFENLPPGVVPLVGPNEAGKSTLRALLADLLYGFDPANREDHPYVPWDGGDTSAEADFEREDGRSFTVRRRLLSAPSGRLTEDGETQDIKNRALPGAAAVPRPLFRGVYDLTREDMSFPVDSWNEVKDRLLGGAGETRFRPAREVAEEMEGEADGLWRPDRRGKPRAKETAERIRELGAALREAKERDRRMRALEKEEEEGAARDEELRERRAGLRERAARIRFWAERKGKIENRRACLDAAGDVEPFADLRAEPLVRLAELDERLREGEEALGERVREREALEASTGGANDGDDRVLDEADRIERAKREAILLARFREDRRARLREIEESGEALRARARDLLADPDRAESLPDLSPGELESRIEAWRKAESARVGLENTAAVLEPVPVTSAALPAVLAAAGVAILAAGFLLFDPPVLYGFLAAGVIALGAAFHLLSRRSAERRANRPIAGEGGRREKAIREAAAAEEERLAAVRSYLVEWGILDHRLREPGGALLSDVKEILALREARRRLDRAAEEAERRIAETEEGILGLAAACGLEERDPERAADRLGGRLVGARERRRERERAEERLPALRAEIAEREARLEELRDGRERIASALRDLGGGDERTGAAALAERREAAENARRIESDLIAEGHDPDALEMELAAALAEEGEPSTEEAERLEEEADQIEEERHAAGKRLAEASAEKEHLSGEPGAAEIEGEREALREETESLKLERDRLVLLAAIVREADRRYRKEHAPDIVKRASSYFSRITGGRYDALEIDPDGEGDLRVLSREKGEWTPAAPPLSRGTLDQVYLALRLALVDHIEGEGEPLPLLLDEVFLHWDGARAGEGYALLEEIAAKRQVFLFTCRPEALPESIAAAAIRMIGPDGPGGAEVAAR